MRIVHRCLCFVATAGLLAAGSGTAIAQEAKSAALAKELAQLLDQRKLDSIAGQSTDSPDTFVGALYFPGQLLVVAAKYSVPVLLNEKIAAKDYRSVYIDLNSASVPDSKIFVSDLGADGLRAKREENQPFDSIDAAGKTMRLDGKWKDQKMSEQDYMKAFADADARYAEMLSALLAELKKTS